LFDEITGDCSRRRLSLPKNSFGMNDHCSRPPSLALPPLIACSRPSFAP
jgi:hypothetical protein